MTQKKIKTKQKERQLNTMNETQYKQKIKCSRHFILHQEPIRDVFIVADGRVSVCI